MIDLPVSILTVSVHIATAIGVAGVAIFNFVGNTQKTPGVAPGVFIRHRLPIPSWQ
jgi:hypothetical protein